MSNFLTQKEDVCRLMLLLPPDRMSHITFHASCFAQGHEEGSDCLDTSITKVWADPLEQEYFDKVLALFEEVNRIRDENYVRTDI